MKLLYFEDDAIDQRLFKRASKNLEDLDITYYDSYLNLNEDYINSYDGIIIDQYLKDCSAIQFRDKHITVPIAVLSASEKFNGSEEGFIGIWQKPIKENILLNILQKMQAQQKLFSISLEYINELTEDNEEERQDLLQSIYDSIEAHNKALVEYDKLSEGDIQQHLHKQKSKIGIFYLEDLHKKIDNAENQLKNGEPKDKIKFDILEITSSVEEVLKELRTYIKN